MADKKNNTGDWNSGDWNSGDWNSGDWNSGDWNSGYWNSGDRNSGYWNSGNWNSGDRNSGYWNSGNWNSGDRNSGIFNTDEPPMRAFNAPCAMTYSEFRKQYGYNDIDFPLNVWCEEAEMSDEEKKSVSGWEQMGGYLKTLSYKEAWIAGWAKATKEQKEWYQSFPNFDANIFREITGIDIQAASLKGKKVKVELDGKKYTATID